VAARRKARRDFGPRTHRTDRKPAAERLGQRHDVGLDARVLIREEAPRAPHSRLYFVKNQWRLVAIAPVAQSLQVIRARHDDAALALDWFDHDADGFVAPRAIERREIVERHESEARHQWLKPLMVSLLAGRAHGGERTSMERPQRRQNLVAATARVAAPSARELDRRLVRFRTGIAEKNFAAVEAIREALGQPRGRLGVKDVGHVGELFGLLFDRAHDARIPVAETRDREPAEKIEVAIAVRIVKIRAVAAHERERQTPVNVDQVPMRDFYYFRIVHRS